MAWLSIWLITSPKAQCPASSLLCHIECTLPQSPYCPVLCKGAGSIHASTLVVWAISQHLSDPKRWLPCNSKQKSSYSVSKATSSQSSLSEKPQFSNMTKHRLYLPLFQYSFGLEQLQGVRGELTLLASLMLHNLLSSCIFFEQLLERPLPSTLPAGKEPISPALLGGFREECAEEEGKPVLQPSAAWKEQSLPPKSKQIVSIKPEEIKRKLLTLIKGL